MRRPSASWSAAAWRCGRSACSGRRRASRRKARAASAPSGWTDFTRCPSRNCRSIAALGRHAEVTLTFESAEPRLLAMGFREERLARVRPAPARAVVRAPSIEREAEEIARRILEQAAAGRPFREMGIVVRAADTYVPLLRSTLERFGIPARFYFDQNLEEHAVTRFLTGAVDAMLGGWDHAQTLAVLRLDARLADSNALDRMDFEVREQAPNRGLDALKALAGGERKLLQQIDALRRWRSGAGWRWPAEGLGRAPAIAAATVPRGSGPRGPADSHARPTPWLWHGAARRRRWICSTRRWTKPARRWRPIAGDSAGGVLAGGEIGAAAETAAAGGWAPQRGPRAERPRGAAVGAAGGVRVRDGGERVPAVPAAGSCSSRTTRGGA